MQASEASRPSALAPSAERLRAAGLRPTAARVGVLEVMATHGAAFATAAELCRCLLQRGARASGGTIYRAIHDLELHGLLLRVPDRSRRSLYRLRVHTDPPGTLQVVCHRTGRTLTIVEPALADHLASILQEIGFDAAGQTLTICLDPDRNAPGVHGDGPRW
ncbi:Fur family transcriptional regulator [Variovorax saccharolyticus]|uniref:Fur family transcriptional regulator n=1 Tax=Variovorax saccharolyticus TaxID=3053516 RepID=UPI0025780341|nr:transcriptional repressor [Variovorax sp. J31P216]MDM0026205.1 transcriptional repressor [Variovorax sp. J31P216]